MWKWFGKRRQAQREQAQPIQVEPYQPDEEIEIRPRFGALKHQDGTMTVVAFVPYGDDGTSFVPILLTGESIEDVWQPSDSISIDVLGPGQAVVLPFNPTNITHDDS